MLPPQKPPFFITPGTFSYNKDRIVFGLNRPVNRETSIRICEDTKNKFHQTSVIPRMKSLGLVILKYGCNNLGSYVLGKSLNIFIITSLEIGSGSKVVKGTKYSLPSNLNERPTSPSILTNSQLL